LLPMRLGRLILGFAQLGLVAFATAEAVWEKMDPPVDDWFSPGVGPGLAGFIGFFVGLAFGLLVWAVWAAARPCLCWLRDRGTPSISTTNRGSS